MAKIIETERKIKTPSLGEIEAAKSHPNGWVYRIDGVFSADDDIPPSAIIGAWQVNENGQIFGDFKFNPNYQGKKS
jgi:hypothetical protein